MMRKALRSHLALGWWYQIGGWGQPWKLVEWNATTGACLLVSEPEGYRRWRTEMQVRAMHATEPGEGGRFMGMGRPP